MSVIRNLLLAGSENTWLREQATRQRFIRRAVSRFMPGESLEEAFEAAQGLRRQGMSTILTILGENVSDREEASLEVEHYDEVLSRLSGSGLDAEISVKVTHLGLDLDMDFTCENVRRIGERAAAAGTRLWIDMEGSAYTDRTIEVYRRVKRSVPTLGIALQAYLRRTRAELESLLPLGPAVRIVKGAYREPASIAYSRMQDTCESYLALCTRLLSAEARRAGAWLAVATHDPDMIAAVREVAERSQVPRDAFEFALLYGIRRDEQQQLVKAGHRVRVLISY